MTLQELFSEAILKISPDENRMFDLSCILEDIFSVQRYALPLCGDKPAPPDKAARFRALVERYIAGEPLQYLLGAWEFYGLTFEVGLGVLIPRQDTETLVDVCLAELHDTSAPVIADLCAGSGCIGIALASRRPDARVYALERSDAAVPYLMRNVAKNAVQVEILHTDVLCPPDTLPQIDLVVSNPPYLSAEEMDALDPLVAHEPAMALAGGADGYLFYRALPALWYPLMVPDGLLAFEVGYTQAAQVITLMEAAGFRNVTAHPDMCNVNRVVTGRK